MEPCPGQVRRPTLERGADAPHHAPMAELASEDDFRAPLERLLSAVLGVSGAIHGIVRSNHPRTGRTLLIVRAGQPVLASKADLDDLCARCNDECSKPSGRVCHCFRLATGETGDPAYRAHVTALHYRREHCGNLILFFPEDTEARAELDGLLGALGEILGLALENTRRAEHNGETMQHHLCSTLMEERQLLANEVHDSLAQNLACMRMRATLLRDALQRQDGDRAGKYLAEVEHSLTVAHGRVRELITQFRTAMDPRGLLFALREEISGMDGLGGVQLAFDNKVAELHLPAEQEMQILHIVREALANIVRHARASHGRVTLLKKAGRYEIAVEDDGVGMGGPGEGGDSDHGHYGLNIMRERALRLGGDVSIESNRGQGTRVLLHFPATRKEARK